MPTTTATSNRAGGAKTPIGDLDALATFLVDQTAAALKQSEAIVTVARKQAISNLHQAQTLALETLGRIRGLTADAVPALPSWMPVSPFTSTAFFGFDVAEQVLATERTIASGVIDLFAPTGS